MMAPRISGNWQQKTYLPYRSTERAFANTPRAPHLGRRPNGCVFISSYRKLYVVSVRFAPGEAKHTRTWRRHWFGG